MRPIIFYMNQEIWFQIPSYIDNICPYYYISTFGRIYSYLTNIYLALQSSHNGYVIVSLQTTNGKRITKRVSRLLMMTVNYFEGCENYQVNHKDGNILNNNLWNLEWTTPKENVRHAVINNLKPSMKGENNPHSKITEKDAMKIYELLVAGYNDKYIQNQINCNNDIIRNIAFGQTWRHLFTDEQRQKMLSTRKGHIITVDDKHKICKYFEDNKLFGYGAVKKMIIGALNYCNIPISDTTFKIVKRLYYKYDNPEITLNYKY